MRRTGFAAVVAVIGHRAVKARETVTPAGAISILATFSVTPAAVLISQNVNVS